MPYYQHLNDRSESAIYDVNKEYISSKYIHLLVSFPAFQALSFAVDEVSEILKISDFTCMQKVDLATVVGGLRRVYQCIL